MSKEVSNRTNAGFTAGIKAKLLKPKKLVALKKPSKDLGGPTQLLVNSLAIFIISQLIAAFIVEIILGFMHGGTDVGTLLNNSSSAQLFYILIAEGLATGLVVKIVKRKGLNLAFIGLGRRPVWRDLWRALGGFIVFYALLIVTSLLLSWLFPSFNTNQKQDLGFNNLNTSLDSVFAFIALVILPPFGEEPLIRGYLFSGLRARSRFIPAMLITSLFFGAAHLEIGSGGPLVWGAAIDTFVLSLVLVRLRETTGALYAGILVHMLNNLVAFGVHFH